MQNDVIRLGIILAICTAVWFAIVEVSEYYAVLGADFHMYGVRGLEYVLVVTLTVIAIVALTLTPIVYAIVARPE